MDTVVENFAVISKELADALCSVLPAFVARLEGELLREGIVDLSVVSGLEDELCGKIQLLLALPADQQDSPPIALIRHITSKYVEALVPERRRSTLRDRGLLPSGAIDIDPELADVHLRWGIAKARVLAS
ncbi:MAG: hypothetical protein ACYDHP_11375 [Ferrimicrobium sp.]